MGPILREVLQPCENVLVYNILVGVEEECFSSLADLAFISCHNVGASTDLYLISNTKALIVQSLTGGVET